MDTRSLLSQPRVAPRPRPAERLPTEHITGKVLGFRTWGLDGYKLRSSYGPLGAHWTVGANKAECRYREYLAGKQAYGSPPKPGLTEPHAAPHPDCMCGLYARHDPPPTHAVFGGVTDDVVGAVLAWGHLEVHAGGIRAEYAEPVVLAYDVEQTYRHVTTLQAIAGELDVPLVDVRELEECAREHGEPVPPQLRPPRRPFAEMAIAMSGFNATLRRLASLTNLSEQEMRRLTGL